MSLSLSVQAVAGEDPRWRALGRARGVATGLLVAMVALYGATSLAVAHWPWLGYLRAFSEAAVVGGVADWFAVTALFRRPLGLPIPHTAIIPRNKDRIGQALGRFIADNFLTEEVLDDRLRQIEVARWGGDWLRQPRNARRLARRLAAAAPGVLRALPKDLLQDVAASGAMAAVRSVPAAPVASKVLAAAWNEGRAQALFDWGVERLTGYLTDHGEMIQAKVEAQSYKWMPQFVDKLIADKITAGLLDWLQELRGPDHPWRQEVRLAVEDFIERLAHDPELRARGEALKLELLEDPRFKEQARAIWSELMGGMTSGGGPPLAARLEPMLLSLGAWLEAEPDIQARLNAWARSLVREVIAPRRHEVGAFVAQVVSSWDTQSVSDKLELQVGKDLQFIRINGALVGGGVGLALYAISQALGL